jgi:hypothetical protein
MTIKLISSMPLAFLGMRARIFGGPYEKRPRHAFGVSMRECESNKYDINVPTQDFKTPDPALMRAAVRRVLLALFTDEVRMVYVGCGAGIGRTGLFMACAAKVCGYRNPVAHARRTYHKQAVETLDQRRFVRSFPVWGLRFALAKVAVVQLTSRLRRRRG